MFGNRERELELKCAIARLVGSITALHNIAKIEETTKHELQSAIHRAYKLSALEYSEAIGDKKQNV